MKLSTLFLAAGAFLLFSKKSSAAVAPPAQQSSPWRAIPATAALTQGNKVVAFSAPTSLEQGSAIVFDSAQPGVVYQLATAVTSTTATLDRPYTGPTTAAARVSVSP